VKLRPRASAEGQIAGLPLKSSPARLQNHLMTEAAKQGNADADKRNHYDDCQQNKS